MRIERRARAYVDRVTAATGLSHLKHEDRARLLARLLALRGGARLAAVETEHRADEVAAALHAEMPWMGPATEAVWHALRRGARAGRPGMRLPPLLLGGPPGIGRSVWARGLARALDVPTCAIDAGTGPAGFAVAGTQRGWGAAGPGKVLETILRTLVANPLVVVGVVVDEVAEAGMVRSERGVTHSLANALLLLLEPSTAATWACPHFRVRFDMSWVGGVLTASATEGLPAPLLAGCRRPTRRPSAGRSSWPSARARRGGGRPERGRAGRGPMLSRWQFVGRDGIPALRGSAPDRPHLVGRDIVTSRLLCWTPRRTWARTRSRWYRLGPSVYPTRLVARDADALSRTIAADIHVLAGGTRMPRVRPSTGPVAMRGMADIRDGPHRIIATRWPARIWRHAAHGAVHVSHHVDWPGAYGAVNLAPIYWDSQPATIAKILRRARLLPDDPIALAWPAPF